MTMLNLALQGGGSHGAFTWGVLDALLAEASLEFPSISGTSAGAVNAVALASGWATATSSGASPRENARRVLRGVWNEVANLSPFGRVQRELLQVLTGCNPLFAWHAISPLAFNPLEPLLARHVDFEALRGPGAPRVLVGATQVRTGRAAIFSGADLTLQAVLASTCLPQLFPPVSIGGELYWDGGYSVNPPLAPFLHGFRGGDVLIVQINSVRQSTLPGTPQEVYERANELTFNAGLLSQIRAVEHINQLVKLGILPRERQLRMHRIDGGEALARFPQSTRSGVDAGLVRELFALGQESAVQWLRSDRAALGHRETLPYADYADDTWLEFQGLVRARGWQGAWQRAKNAASRVGRGFLAGAGR
ncbi:patatin-like phospholipase family protein [Ramlibacter tataouinensis]|uniref:patatin-like phospholipase family protein n=1 Tax=Ramlibacter tataouinensis TaxID=94132 RepID=UPI0009EE413D|nr:patatin-like phospholipase family protein [Ramlibacter tataouinensis]